MKITAIAPWFGSKRTLAPRIVAELGDHRIYWEPFCGSCSVLFSKERATYETVNDLHKDLINLARVVQDETTALDLYGRVSRCLFHEDLLPIAKGKLTESEPPADGIDVERAYWYLVFSWMGLNGISGTPLQHTGTFAVRYSGKGGNGATRWASVCKSIPDWHQRTPPVPAVDAMRQQLAVSVFGAVKEADVEQLTKKLHEMAMSGDHKAMKMYFELIGVMGKQQQPAPPAPAESSALKMMAEVLEDLVDEIRVSRRPAPKELTAKSRNGTTADD